MSRRGTIITITSLALVFVATVFFSWRWIILDKAASAQKWAEIEERQALAREQAEAELAAQPKKVYDIPPIQIPKDAGKPVQPLKDQQKTKPKNEVEATGRNTGEVSKPEPPPPPEIPEERKKDPTSKPEYTPEQIKPNDPDAGKDSESPNSTPKPDSGTDKPDSTPKPDGGTDKPSTPNPDGGAKNDKGEVYVPGFGWMPYSPGGQGHVVGNPGDELTGNKVGIM